MAARMVKRLSQLEIDEVSLVDRPANQHGLVAIAKNDQEDTEMDQFYDAEGYPVDVTQLQPGDKVYSEDGREHVYTETEDVEDGQEDGQEYAEQQGERELVGVGKGVFPLSGAKGKAAVRLGRGKAQEAGAKVAGFASRNRGALGAGAGGAAVGYGAGRVGKSFGDEVLETLSKALNDGERDVAIAKALDRVEQIAKRNVDLEATVAALVADREREDFVELAKAYDGLPARSDELADILQSAAQALTPEQLQVLDRVLTGASEVGKSYLEVIGFDGEQDSDVLAQVYGMADAAVAKNAELGLTREQAVTALFSTNPEAYDQYELENRR